MNVLRSLLLILPACWALGPSISAQNVFDEVLPRTARWSVAVDFDIADCNGFPNAAVAAHVDADTRLDLIVVDQVCGISVLIARDDRLFEDFVHTPAPHSTATSFVITDLNHDGLVDVVLPDRDELRVLLGRGDGGFWPEESHPIDGRALSVEHGDFNEDGHQDLIAPARPGPAALLFGTGDGGFEPAVMREGAGDDVAVADFDGDGHLDYVVNPVFGPDTDRIAVYYGRGDGTFEPRSPVELGGWTSRLEAEDLDRDGRTDLFILPSPDHATHPAVGEHRPGCPARLTTDGVPWAPGREDRWIRDNPFWVSRPDAFS